MSESVEKLKMIGVDVVKDKLDIAFDNQKLITIANTEILCVVMEAREES